MVNDNNIYDGFYLKSRLRPFLYVYYLRDMLTAMTYWKTDKQTGTDIDRGH